MTAATLPESAPATLADWQQPPLNKWGLLHTRELVPTQRIRAAATSVRPLTHRDRSAELAALQIVTSSGEPSGLAPILRATHADGVVIAHRGEVVFERYFGDMTADTPHLLQSVSKSLVGCVAAVLADRGELDLARVAEHYVPEVAGTGYARATIRDLLDMRVGVRFNEDYLDPEAEVCILEEHAGWRPAIHGQPAGIYPYLSTLTSEEPHGRTFRYRSSNTDMLGWICERVSGTRMAELISSLLWQPMGAQFDAEVTCDRTGTAFHEAGVCARARDLLRFGLLLLEGGARGGQQIIPAAWLVDARCPQAELTQAFAGSDNAGRIPGGWYRSKFWFAPGLDGQPVQICLGVYGQMIVVDHGTQTVSIKLSSSSEATGMTDLHDSLNAFSAIGRHLSGLAEQRWF